MYAEQSHKAINLTDRKIEQIVRKALKRPAEQDVLIKRAQSGSQADRWVVVALGRKLGLI